MLAELKKRQKRQHTQPEPAQGGVGTSDGARNVTPLAAPTQAPHGLVANFSGSTSSLSLPRPLLITP